MLDLPCLLEAAIELKDAESLRLLVPLLAECPTVVLIPNFHGSLDRLLGAAYAQLGDTDSARSHLERALEACSKISYRPEVALVRFHLAGLLFDKFPDEHADAIAHLEFAIGEFREMHMEPSLRRAVALQQRIHGTSAKGTAYPDGLSEREVEVLQLVAAGKTDKEIAEALVIAVPTPEITSETSWRRSAQPTVPRPPPTPRATI